MKRTSSLPLLVLLLALAGLARADSNFDLAGPPLDVKVMRDGKTLPISQVPNLEAGDRVWLHPDLPLAAGCALSTGRGLSARLDQSSPG